MTRLSHPDHPIWTIILIAVIMIGAYYILKENATVFDKTEWKSIGELAVLIISGIGAKDYLSSRKHKKEQKAPLEESTY